MSRIFCLAERKMRHSLVPGLRSWAHSLLMIKVLCWLSCYPAFTLKDAPVIAPKSARSPLRPTPIPFTNTVRELPVSLARWATHLIPNLMKCCATLSPRTNIGLLLANTVLWDAFTGAEVEHKCPVLHLSLFLDILGMTVFMDAKNRCDYNLNLLNWPFLTSCLMPPTM